jgi:uncharacterized membrane protein
MNPAHYHLLINHFPIIGLFFGIGILIYGLIKKNSLLLNISYVIFIICMITGKVSMMTGDKAEHFIENISGFSHDLIEEHEESAENFMKIMYLLGLLSIAGLYVNFKKNKKAHLISYLILLTSIVAVVLAKPVGTSGGEIRHTEIRVGNSTAKTNSEAEKEEHDE